MKAKSIIIPLMVLGLSVGSFADNNFQIEWITPSSDICKSNGGKVDSQGCKATWKVANNICHASGGELPTINMLESVITECGGEIMIGLTDEATKNKSNLSYQSCYKKKGFSPMFYCSSDYMNRYIKYIFFLYGVSGIGKSNVESHIRCVKNNRDTNSIGKDKESLELYQKASDKGDAEAQFKLGNMYYDGIKVEKNFTKAIELFNKSCDGENSQSCLILGSIYINGDIVEINPIKALKFFKKSCDAGEAMGCDYYSTLKRFSEK